MSYQIALNIFFLICGVAIAIPIADNSLVSENQISSQSNLQAITKQTVSDLTEDMLTDSSTYYGLNFIPGNSVVPLGIGVGYGILPFGGYGGLPYGGYSNYGGYANYANYANFAGFNGGFGYPYGGNLYNNNYGLNNALFATPYQSLYGGYGFGNFPLRTRKHHDG